MMKWRGCGRRLETRLSSMWIADFGTVAILNRRYTLCGTTIVVVVVAATAIHNHLRLGTQERLPPSGSFLVANQKLKKFDLEIFAFKVFNQEINY
jgi:hypothetical protein